jgi:hypothetical protein
MAATAAQLVCSSERRAGATVQCECVPRKLQVYRKALQGYLVVLYLLTVCPGAFRACVRACVGDDDDEGEQRLQPPSLTPRPNSPRAQSLWLEAGL